MTVNDRKVQRTSSHPHPPMLAFIAPHLSRTMMDAIGSIDRQRRDASSHKMMLYRAKMLFYANEESLHDHRQGQAEKHLELSRKSEAMEIKTADRSDNFTLNDPFVMEISVPLKLRIKSDQQRNVNYESSELSFINSPCLRTLDAFRPSPVARQPLTKRINEPCESCTIR